MFTWLNKQSKTPKTLGQLGEELAQLEYKKRGYKIVAANFFNKKGLRLGEIDLVVKDKKKVIFVEVKTRAEDADRFGTAAESVNQFKQIKLLKAVKLFLLRYPKLARLAPQIDVCAIIISDFSSLELTQRSPAKYRVIGKLDKLPHSATIIPNAVEDWN